jgi:putative heme-binding domain-containing protein
MLRSSVYSITLLLGSASVLVGAAPVPHWIWVDPGTPRSKQAFFRCSFDINQEIESAELTGVADFCQLVVWVNGEHVAEIEDFQPRFHLDITRWLTKGKNLLAIQTRSHAGPAALVARLTWKRKDGREDYVITDNHWRTTRTRAEGWQRPEKDVRDWSPAVDLGRLASEPWGDHPDTITITALDDYTQWKQALTTDKGTDPTSFFTQPGFQIELLRSARKDEGSWVSLEFDPKGRLIIAREDRGLLRLTFQGKDRAAVTVETINTTLKECRGLLFAHGALYAHANESRGLYRLRDSNGDDQFDEVKLLRRTEGRVGHGRNDLALGPDGLIYAIHGDAVKLPGDVPHLTSPFVEAMPRAQHGFVLRTDREGKEWQVVAAGMRNPFGIAFNPDGELFTYDADAEYDMGSSWYRPTRVLHLLPGGDYGWRAVTKTWPPYDPDNPDAPPPALDIGKGSPTAVKFGTGSHFPPRYRRALFILDWAYGRILAVHMTPRGGSYAMRAETFLKGRPFNVTGLDFGPEGALYVVTGGRKTQSGLYRIRYTGEILPEPPATPQQQARVNYSAKAREVRRQLEAYHGRQVPAALDLAWPYLDSPDPALRHAARVAVEHQPISQWRERALAENHPLAALTAMLALARGSGAEQDTRISQRLAAFPLKKLPVSQQLIVLRIYEIALSRKTKPEAGLMKQCLEQLDPYYPASDAMVNKSLAELLVKLNAPRVVPRTLNLLARATAQREQFQYLHVLRQARQDWTLEGRQQYFRALARMRHFVGGEGMPTFISRIQEEATAGLTAGEREQIAPLLAQKPPVIDIPALARNRAFVRNWKSSDLMGALAEVGRGRDFERGKKMFQAAACVACHRLQQTGAAIGPDLTSVARRFSRRDILESILDPDKVVAEQYRRDIISTVQGKVLVGTIVPGVDYRAEELQILANPLEPDKITRIAKKDIDRHEKSPLSIMPQGLLDTLSKEEILDLLAYLEAGGNPEHPNYHPGK